MDKDDEIRELMAKLMQAVEASLSTSVAVREALAELVRSGYEARLFFVANTESDDDADETDAEEGVLELSAELAAGPESGAAPDESERRLELTKLDRDFLRSLHIRPEGG